MALAANNIDSPELAVMMLSTSDMVAVVSGIGTTRSSDKV